MPMDAHLQKAFDAVERGDHAELIKVLPSIPDETLHASRETDGFSLATLATSKGHLLAIGALKRRGVDFTRQDDNQDTPLHAAVRSDAPNSERVLSLILHLTQGKVLETPDHKGDSALHIAIEENQPDKLRALIDAGANLSAATSEGDTPLHRAVWHGHVGFTDVLLDAGAPLDMRNYRGETPLHLAVQLWDPDSAVFSGHGAIAQRLCMRGADPSVVDETGLNALHVAGTKTSGDPLRLLLDGLPFDGALDPHIVTVASRYGHVDTMKVLIERGVKVPVVDRRAPGVTQAALAVAHAELSTSASPEQKNFSKELVCPIAGIPFGLSGDGRPVQMPRTTPLMVSHPHQPKRPVTVQRGDMVRADALTTLLASHPNQSESNAFRESTAFREGDRECIARLGAAVDVYLSGAPVERRAEEARLMAETVSGPQYARVAAQWALASLTGDRTAHVRNAAAGSPHSASTRSSSPSLSSPAL